MGARARTARLPIARLPSECDAQPKSFLPVGEPAIGAGLPACCIRRCSSIAVKRLTCPGVCRWEDDGPGSGGAQLADESAVHETTVGVAPSRRDRLRADMRRRHQLDGASRSTIVSDSARRCGAGRASAGSRHGQRRRRSDERLARRGCAAAVVANVEHAEAHRSDAAR